MFIILLRLTERKSQAASFMDGHKAWIKQGLDDGVFLLVGSLQPNAGGVILAHNATPDAIRDRIKQDPFVAENIAVPEILEISPAMAEERMQFLLG